MNNVTLIGNVVRDLELKTFDDGNGERNYVQLTLAVNNFDLKKNEKSTDFIEVVAFDRKAEVLVEYITKGRQIAVEGKLSARSYEDKEGRKRRRLAVILTNFTFINDRKNVNTEERVVNGDIPF